MNFYSLMMLLAVLLPFLDAASGNKGPALRRARRIQAFIFFVLLASTLLPLGVIAASTNLLQDGMKAGEQAVTRMRTAQLHVEDNLAELFPDKAGKEKQACRRARLTRAIDRAWQDEFYNQSCAVAPLLCARSEQDYFERVRMTHNPYNQLLLDLDVMGMAAEPVFATAQRMADHRPEIAVNDACGDLQPSGWMVAYAPVVNTSFLYCIGGCD